MNMDSLNAFSNAVGNRQSPGTTEYMRVKGKTNLCLMLTKFSFGDWKLRS